MKLTQNNRLNASAANDGYQGHHYATLEYGIYIDIFKNLQLVKLLVSGNEINMINIVTGEFTVPALRSQFAKIIPEREVLKFISEFIDE